MRNPARQLGTPSLRIPVDTCKEGQKGAHSSKRMMLAKAMKAARAAKADLTTEPPLGSSSPPPHSLPQLQTPGSPPPIAAVPLAVATSPSPTTLDKGKRVLEVLSDDEDSDGGLVFKRRRAVRVPTPPAASPQGGSSLRDNPPSASSPIPATVQGEKGDGAACTPTPPPAGTSVTPATSAATLTSSPCLLPSCTF